MTLEKEIELLEKKLKLLKEIKEYENKSNLIGDKINPEPIDSPFIFKNEYCNHEYPNPWMGTIAPFCKKCGQQADNFVIWTSATGDVDTTGIIATEQFPPGSIRFT